MPDEFFARTLSPPGQAGRHPGKRNGASWRAVLGITLLAFIGGAVLVGYLLANGKIALSTNGVRLAGQTQPASQPAGQPTGQPAGQPAGLGPAPVLDQRIAAMEQRLTQIDAKAGAAEAKTDRAETLLIVAAARRTIDRGAPLGLLGDQLKLRFGATQGAALQTLSDASRAPVTLVQLAVQLDALGPQLTNAPANESAWDRFRRDVSGLFVIRREDTPAARPEDRLAQARLMLRTGQADAAAAQVASLPPSPAARAWVVNARRYAAIQRALDTIEGAALIAPGITPKPQLPATQTAAPTPPSTPRP